MAGIAVNHVADWNPNYRISNRTVSLGAGLPSPESAAFAPAVLDRFGWVGDVQGMFRRDPSTVEIFLDGATVSVDIEGVWPRWRKCVSGPD